MGHRSQVRVVAAHASGSPAMSPTTSPVASTLFRALQGMEQSLLQGFLVLGIFAAVSGFAWVGLGAPTRFLIMLCGVCCAEWYRRRSPWLYLTLTLWFWTLTPFIRRVIDYRAGFTAADIVLVTPDVMALLMLPELLKSRTLWRRPETLVVMLLLGPATYGLCVSLVQGQVVAAVAAGMDWFVPLFYFLYILQHIPRVDEAEPHLRGFVTLNSLVIVAYGINQLFNPPAWDVSWSLASGLLADSQVQAETFHVFGTLSNVGEQAQWLGAIILLSMHFRTRLTVILQPLLCVLLMVTYVRSVAVGVLFAFLVTALFGPRRMTAGLAGMIAAIIIAGACVVSFNPKVSDLVLNRLGSLSSLQTDDSALQRSSIWAQTPALIDAHPFGMGIGSLGRGAVASGNADFVSVDSGPLAVFLTLGWVCGTIYLLGLVVALAQAFFVAVRVRTPVVLACMAAALCNAPEFVLVNIYGFAGSTIWICVGLVVAWGIRSRRGAMAYAAARLPASHDPALQNSRVRLAHGVAAVVVR